MCGKMLNGVFWELGLQLTQGAWTKDWAKKRRTCTRPVKHIIMHLIIHSYDVDADAHDHKHADIHQLLVQKMISTTTPRKKGASGRSSGVYADQRDGRIPDPQLAQRRKC